jgi:hypothetical protein
MPHDITTKIQFKFLNAIFTIFSPLVVPMDHLAIAQCAAVGGAGAVLPSQRLCHRAYTMGHSVGAFMLRDLPLALTGNRPH